MWRSLNLTQIVPCVLDNSPSVFLLITFDSNHAICVGGKDNRISVLIQNRLFIPEEKLEFGPCKPLGHIAGFVLHEIDAGNRT